MNTHQEHHVDSVRDLLHRLHRADGAAGRDLPAWYFDLGLLGILLGDMVGIVKATIIILFMHVRHSSKMVWVIAISGFVWLGILIPDAQRLFHPHLVPAASPPGG